MASRNEKLKGDVQKSEDADNVTKKISGSCVTKIDETQMWIIEVLDNK
jgi:hypothetical protein